MKRFTQLFVALDGTNRSSEKQQLLEAYFAEAPAADAAWALQLLRGKRSIKRLAASKLKRMAAEFTGMPLWLVDECHQQVGDLSETLSLLIRGREDEGAGTDQSLCEVMETVILPLGEMNEQEQAARLAAFWPRLSRSQCLVFHKLISGSFRVGVSSQMVVRALSAVSGLDRGVMAHRLMGEIKPDAAGFGRLMSREPTEEDVIRPYPFCLASPLAGEVGDLGACEDWLAEWKWDGIRAQIIRRAGRVLVWSRGEERIERAFPELRAIGAALADGTVIDGEVLAWENGRALPFGQLQRRLNRKQVEPMLFDDVPVMFMAYDLLEFEGVDQRELPLETRRCRLGELVAGLIERDESLKLGISEALDLERWSDAEALMERARAEGTEGLMIKRRDSQYGVGRVRGDWWKWKVEPYSVDAVLTAAEMGHGQRAGLLTDYTFSLWEDGQLVPFARAYSGLTQEEIHEVDKRVRRHTTGRHGPVRTVEPVMVFEIGFEAVTESRRHRSGFAVRFPRILRWRHDKLPAEADRLSVLRNLLGVCDE